MHQAMRPRPLGGLQLRHLHELREAKDNGVRERHLKRNGDAFASSRDVHGPIVRQVSRTVDAIVQQRLQARESVSASTRVRNQVATARCGIQTERSVRLGDELQDEEQVKSKTTRKIVAVRRRGEATAHCEERSDGRRRIGKEEAEWIERDTQYRARAAILEKECVAAWQCFLAGAGTSSLAEVNQLMEELETFRGQDFHTIKHQLDELHSKLNDVHEKVRVIENGDQFLSELQDRIDAMEAALAKSKSSQRQLFDKYVVEEKMLEKELAVFMEKMASWENETPPRPSSDNASNTSLEPRLVHLTSRPRSGVCWTSSSRLHGRSSHSGDARDNNPVEDQPGSFNDHDMVDRVRQLNDAILRSGGLAGGWDKGEHGTFTALLVKFGLSDEVLFDHLFSNGQRPYTLQLHASNQESHQEEPSKDSNRSDFETRIARFLRKCMREIVTQTKSSVRSHFEWYLGHLELVEEKKRLIQEWKAKKEEQRQQVIQCSMDADDKDLGSLNRGEIPGTTTCRRNIPDSKTKIKSREKTDRLLEEWKREKEQKKEEHEQRRREHNQKREAVEAKRKQEQLDAKQKVLLYRLHKEQEGMILDDAARLRSRDATEDKIQAGLSSFSFPTPKEDLVERSKIAIEYAKAKRLRLQQIQERKQKQQRLPPRPGSKIAGKCVDNSIKPVLVFSATEASKSRALSKDELQKKARRRERQGAHDAFIPGEKALPDVRFKSFGHVPIQPRAVPAWRRNI